MCLQQRDHKKRRMIGNSLEMVVPWTVSLSKDIVHAVYVTVSIESLARFLFTRRTETESLYNVHQVWMN